jgi:histone arginine demethylase JMJD6
VKIGEDDLGYKIKIKFKYFLEYMIHNRDDSPLYLFESSIENHKELKSLIDDYVVPKYFMEDLFKYVGNDRRPPYRWFLIGPERSGTTIHIDPLGTSAWNTSIFGYKLWLLLPPEIPKSIAKGKDCLLPGEDDEAIMYFRNIFPRLKLKYPDMKEIIFVQKPGETVYIPGGWWHTVVNLSDTIAITQNYCSSINFPQVWKCVRKERKKMSVIFLKQLKIHRPDLYKLALEMNEKDGYIMYNKNDQFLKKKRRDRRESDNSDSSSSSSSSTLNSDEFDY